MAPIIMAFAGDFLETQFWCCPGLGHLNPFIKLHRGVFMNRLAPSPLTSSSTIYNNLLSIYVFWKYLAVNNG